MDYTDAPAIISAQLPQDLIIQALIRLPAKSLLCFRCVSKRFCSFIDSKYFVKSHLNRPAEDFQFHPKFIMEQDCQLSTSYNTAKLHLPKKFVLGYSPRKGLDAVCYCNGVFLLFVEDFQIALWNPSTHQYRVLPCFPGLTGRLEDRRYNSTMGFGYDSAHDNYKVVIIQSVADWYGSREFHVWIFGLSSNSWRRVCRNSLAVAGVIKFSNECGHFAHGNLHWCCSLSETDLDYEDVVAFDMAEETFSIVSRPVQPYKYNYGIMFTGLSVLDGCLIINYVSSSEHSNSRTRQTQWSPQEAFLYVGKKEGAEFTWNLLYSVTQYQLPGFLDMDNFEDAKVLGYSNNRDKIFLDFGLGFMVSYDVEEKVFEESEITVPTCYAVSACVESLVSLFSGDTKEDEKEGNNICLF